MSNSVDIYINGHERDLLQAIERTKAAIASLRDSKATVTVDVDDGALNVLKAKLAALRDGDVTVDVNVNDAKLAALRAKMDALRNTRVKVTVDVDRTELNILRTELAGLRDRSINVDIDSDLAGFRAALAASTLGNANARINLDLDTAAAAAELAAFLAAVPRSVTINLDVDTAGAAAELAAFRVAMLALNNDSIRLGASTGGNAASGIARMGASAGTSLPLLGALALAVAPLASGAAGLGILGTAAALGAVTAAAGGMSVAFGLGAAALPIAAAAASEEVKSSFTTMKDDVVSTMKEIAQPVEQPLIDLASSLGTAFESIRPSLDVVTAGAARLVGELSGKMPAIANEVGPALEKMFTAAEPHIKNLIGNIPEYVRAFGDFAGKLGDPAIVEGAQRVFGAIPGIIDGAGDALVGAGEAFGDLMGWLDAGNLSGFTDGIGKLFENLSNTDWSGVTAGLADAGNAFGDFMANIDTQNLATNIEGITQFATDLTSAADKVVSEYQRMDEAFRQSNEDAGGGPVEWGAKAADWMKSSLLDGLTNFSTTGLFDTLFPPGDPPVIPAPEITPPDTSAINDPFAMLPPAVLPAPVVTPPDAGAVNDPFAAMPPAVLPAPVVTPPDTSVIGGALENIAPPTIEAPVVPAPEVTPSAPIPAPEVTPPPPVPVTVEVVEGEAVTVPPPAPVPITFDVTQPTLELTPPPPVPITFNVTLPTISIPAPAPVPVSVQVDTSGANVNLSGAGARAGQSFASGLAGSAGAVAGAAASMAAAASSVSVNLSGQGAAAGASFAAGLASQAGAVAAAAAQLGAVAAANKGVYKGRKGIAADRIMLIPHGQAMVRGFIDGLGSQRRELITEASSLAQAVTKRFDEELVPNIGLSGGVGVQQVVHVTVEAGLMADPVVIGREVRDVLGAYASAVGGSETISV
ncbi:MULTISPECIES: hypothetical protein [unclassified Rhodococcus (in: high G+C Gram-positive bacteria)]|uniref:hypothetical protein n=1 Tax=unclassified Rhodococcus (in: high G+C Gram-positive bacteria) TaxID=192944 RepID=UPI0007BBE29E|nr:MULTISPECIES: hypothetical protein [unclassified Rhodococcus (in: high G+C Gram-positive bacteria)]KZF04773.1 hypothetical protein A2J04_05590 [Rhodococcus sp. EPR-279]KZF08679.1 hypothetical protein A2J02_20645 [Rhodococcus sp. EPR-147]